MGRGLLPTEAEAPFSPHSWLWGDTDTRGVRQLEAKQKLNLIPLPLPPTPLPAVLSLPTSNTSSGGGAISSLKHRPYLRDKGFAPGLLCLSPFPAAPPFPEFSINPPPPSPRPCSNLLIPPPTPPRGGFLHPLPIARCWCRTGRGGGGGGWTGRRLPEGFKQPGPTVEGGGSRWMEPGGRS